MKRIPHPSLRRIARDFVKENGLAKIVISEEGTKGHVVILKDGSLFLITSSLSKEYAGINTRTPIFSQASYGLIGNVKTKAQLDGTILNLAATSNHRYGDATATRCREDHSQYWFLTPGSK